LLCFELCHLFPEHGDGGEADGSGEYVFQLLVPVDEKYWLAHNVFHIAKTAGKDAFRDLPIYFDVQCFEWEPGHEPEKRWVYA